MPTDFLTDAERERLSTYPEEISSGDLGRFFTLTPHDLEIVVQQRGDHNRLGFALQLCTLHYLGFIPNNLLDPPPAVVRLLAHQLGVSGEALQVYGEREQTRSDHLAQILPHLGYRRTSLHDLAEIEAWLVERALEHDQPTFLLHTVTERLRWDRLVRPGLTSLERIVAAARERAREVTYEHVSHLLSAQGREFLDELVELRTEEFLSSSRTTLSWLQNMPNDHTAPQIIATLDKIRFLQEAGVPTWDLSAINPNRLKYLANVGARATNQQLQRSSAMRRYPVLVAFVKQALFDLTDVAIDLFDACLWQRHVDAKKELDAIRLQAARSTNEKLRTYSQVVRIIVDGGVADAAVRAAVFERYQSDHLQQVVEETEHLLRPRNDEAIDLFAQRYSYIRKFAPSLLTTLTFRSHKQEDPLLGALEMLRTMNASGSRTVPATAPTAFIADAWWEYVLERNGSFNRRYYELAVLWGLRLALRAGDVFVEHARRYADPNTYLIPRQAWPEHRQEVIRLTFTPPAGEARLQEREAELQVLVERVERLHTDPASWLRQEKGKWVLTPLEGEDSPASAEALEDAIAERLPRLDITDLLIEVDQWTGFSQHFDHAAAASPGPGNARNEQALKHLYASLLAQGGNFGLPQMSRASGLAHHQLVYTSTWFLREETLKRANTELVNYHHGLDVSQRWGTGTLSSSDGQRFPVSGKNRQARSILRYFGYRRGVTFYTWTSDQFSLYGGKAIAATVRDATYVLDEILANETELPILEHTTDTSGYTEIVFALFDLLGLTFTPRIKDLADQQLYRTDSIDLNHVPKVRERLSKRIDTRLILDMWDEMLRLAGSLKLGWATASLVIHKLQASPRKSKLAKALQEYGRLIKTLHVLGWYESKEKRRWANRQLNKGEAVHSLKAYLSVGNRGVLRRKTDEGLQHQVGCLNLLTNAIILWNSVYMAEVLNQLEQEGQAVNAEDLKHVWPTRFEHVNIYGKYEFNLEDARQRNGLRELRWPDELNP
jgi:TnpA family transposase